MKGKSRRLAQRCLGCGQHGLDLILDAGPQPLSNRYRQPSDSRREYRHSLALAYCGRCGLLQLKTPVPLKHIRPERPGVVYREAEGHLDHLVDRLESLGGITKSSVIWGLTSKDDSTLERLRKRGFQATYRLDPLKDLKIRDVRSGLETIQSKITLPHLSAIAKNQGRPQLILARHILEHAYDPRQFLKSLCSILAPGGYLILEVPNCERALRHQDYTMLWEEHILYFIPDSLKSMLALAGLSVDRFEIIPYPLEDALIAMTSKTARSRQVPRPFVHAKKQIEEYGTGFPSQKEQLLMVMRQLRKKGEKVALMGAGHLSCHFLNHLGLQSEIDYLLDGDPQKQGLLMPGTELSIQSPSLLEQGHVKVCLLGLSPESEKKVLQRNKTFVESGGRFLSIFPGAQNGAVPYLSAGLEGS